MGKFIETGHVLIWVRQGAGLSRGRQDVHQERKRERERPQWNEKRDIGFLFGAILERGLTSLYQASERKGEWGVKRWRQREGENVKETWRRSGFPQHNYQLPPLSTIVFSFAPFYSFLFLLYSFSYTTYCIFYSISDAGQINPESGCVGVK